MTDSPFKNFINAIAMAWPEIGVSCQTCKQADCMGYIAIQPSEQNLVLQSGVQLMRVNGSGGPVFIDSYPRDGEDRAVVGVSKPKCPYRDKDGNCKVHAKKPLICSMYPLGMEMIGSEIYWAVYLDCDYIQRVISDGQFEIMSCSLIDAVHNHLTTEELTEITQTFRQSYALAAWPDGANRTTLIEEVKI